MVTKSYWFLRIGNDYLEEALRYSTKRAAVEEFRRVALELDQYGQAIEGALHCAPKREALEEYPDYMLLLGPRGGVRVEGC